MVEGCVVGRFCEEFMSDIGSRNNFVLARDSVALENPREVTYLIKLEQRTRRISSSFRISVQEYLQYGG